MAVTCGWLNWAKERVTKWRRYLTGEEVCWSKKTMGWMIDEIVMWGMLWVSCEYGQVLACVATKFMIPFDYCFLIPPPPYCMFILLLFLVLYYITMFWIVLMSQPFVFQYAKLEIFVISITYGLVSLQLRSNTPNIRLLWLNWNPHMAYITEKGSIPLVSKSRAFMIFNYVVVRFPW